jgi:hypothetical protein
MSASGAYYAIVAAIITNLVVVTQISKSREAISKFA